MKLTNKVLVSALSAALAASFSPAIALAADDIKNDTNIRHEQNVNDDDSDENKREENPVTSTHPVYVYLHVTGNTDGLQLNGHDWYTIGEISVDGLTSPSDYYNAHQDNYSSYNTSFDAAIQSKINSSISRFDANKELDISNASWYGLLVSDGADDYVASGSWAYHYDGEIDAKYLANYTVSWVDENGNELAPSVTEVATVGSKVTGEEKSFTGYHLDKEKSTAATIEITKDGTNEIRFVYAKNKLNATWYDDDETTVLSAKKINYGDMINANDYTGIPTKADDDEYTYTFDHWYWKSGIISGNGAVTDFEYVAVYKKTKKETPAPDPTPEPKPEPTPDPTPTPTPTPDPTPIPEPDPIQTIYHITYEFYGAVPDGYDPPTDTNDYIKGDSYDLVYMDGFQVPVYDKDDNMVGYYQFQGWDADEYSGTIDDNMTVRGEWVYVSFDDDDDDDWSIIIDFVDDNGDTNDKKDADNKEDVKEEKSPKTSDESVPVAPFAALAGLGAVMATRNRKIFE